MPKRKKPEFKPTALARGIKAYRAQHNITQNAFAKTLGIDPRNLSTFETGRTKNISPELKDKVLQLIGTPSPEAEQRLRLAEKNSRNQNKSTPEATAAAIKSRFSELATEVELLTLIAVRDDIQARIDAISAKAH